MLNEILPSMGGLKKQKTYETERVPDTDVKIENSEYAGKLFVFTGTMSGIEREKVRSLNSVKSINAVGRRKTMPGSWEAISERLLARKLITLWLAAMAQVSQNWQRPKISESRLCTKQNSRR